ncbi:MAG: Gfo/Idh/MocA family oxidoreductase, partial [Planctomycetota bacterium]
MTTTRRIFLGSLAAGVATSLTRPSMADLSSNEEVGVAILGCGGRGGLIAKAINRASHAKVVVACDPDESRAGRLADTYQARTETDLRRAIEQTDVDAVVVTTCNHWHCLAAYWAIEAGKDVYVEKPLSHSQWEGRRIADFAEASHRIVQLGTQQRSDPMQAEARAFLHDENALGPIRYVQANRLGVRGSIGKRSSPLPIPSEVTYDLWLGPAADQP